MALNAQSAFANNNGNVNHEGYIGFHHISSAEYAPFPTFPSNFGAVVVMMIFDPVSDADALARDCNYVVTLDSDNIFGTNDHNNEVLKRGEMVRAILQAKNISPPDTASGTEYTDVSEDHPNAIWIEQFKAEMLSDGCATGKFCPDMFVTREQLAKIFLKAFHGSSYSPMPSANNFGDVPAGSFNADWITDLRDLGFTTGCNINDFCPKQAVTLEWFDYLLTQL